MANPPAASNSAPISGIVASDRNRATALDTKENIETAECVESAKPQFVESAYIPPEEIKARFELLRDLNEEQMEELNKRVLRKIDWRMMPIVTLMYLMK